jgi:hypothetical protein
MCDVGVLPKPAASSKLILEQATAEIVTNCNERIHFFSNKAKQSHETFFKLSEANWSMAS